MNDSIRQLIKSRRQDSLIILKKERIAIFSALKILALGVKSPLRINLRLSPPFPWSEGLPLLREQRVHLENR